MWSLGSFWKGGKLKSLTKINIEDEVRMESESFFRSRGIVELVGPLLRVPVLLNVGHQLKRWKFKS